MRRGWRKVDTNWINFVSILTQGWWKHNLCFSCTNYILCLKQKSIQRSYRVHAKLKHLYHFCNIFLTKLLQGENEVDNKLVQRWDKLDAKLLQRWELLRIQYNDDTSMIQSLCEVHQLFVNVDTKLMNSWDKNETICVKCVKCVLTLYQLWYNCCINFATKIQVVNKVRTRMIQIVSALFQLCINFVTFCSKVDTNLFQTWYKVDANCINFSSTLHQLCVSVDTKLMKSIYRVDTKFCINFV